MGEKMQRAVAAEDELTKHLETTTRTTLGGGEGGEGDERETLGLRATLAEREAQVSTLRGQLREVTEALDAVSGEKKRLEEDMNGRESVVSRGTRPFAPPPQLGKPRLQNSSVSSFSPPNE